MRWRDRWGKLDFPETFQCKRLFFASSADIRRHGRKKKDSLKFRGSVERRNVRIGRKNSSLKMFLTSCINRFVATEVLY